MAAAAAHDDWCRKRSERGCARRQNPRQSWLRRHNGWRRQRKRRRLRRLRRRSADEEPELREVREEREERELRPEAEAETEAEAHRTEGKLREAAERKEREQIIPASERRAPIRRLEYRQYRRQYCAKEPSSFRACGSELSRAMSSSTTAVRSDSHRRIFHAVWIRVLHESKNGHVLRDKVVRQRACRAKGSCTDLSN